MRFKALAAAALAATTAVLTPMNTTALYVPERYQGVIEAVGWAPADIPMLAQVIECESGWNALAVGDSGAALGLLQIRTTTYDYVAGVDTNVPPRNNYWEWVPSVQLYAGRVLHDEQGWLPWEGSRACWE